MQQSHLRIKGFEQNSGLQMFTDYFYRLFFTTNALSEATYQLLPPQAVARGLIDPRGTNFDRSQRLIGFTLQKWLGSFGTLKHEEWVITTFVHRFL